jgi:uncharacterized protein YaiE (UPF0345 family)
MATHGRTFLILAGAAVSFLAVAPESRAQERSDSGDFTFLTTSSEEMPLSDGHLLVRVVQSGMVFAADPASPLDRSATTCSGSMVMDASARGTVVSGHCDMVDEDEDVWTIWYAGDQDGGSWGFMGGTGKFEGVEGRGTFSADAQWADGRGINSWEGTYTLN